MFEIPEYTILARQMNQAIQGKTIQQGDLGNSPHKFVWYNCSPAEFNALTQGKVIGPASSRGRWLFLPLEPGYVMVLGECGGRVLFHPADEKLPAKYHLHLAFTDGSVLTATTQMWGAMELYQQGQELQRQYIHGMRPTPIDPEFTGDYFANLVSELSKQEKRSVKGLLTQDQIIPGLGNSIAQDILFHARLHPRHAIQEMSAEQTHRLYHAIIDTVQAVISQGGRYDEVDLFGQPGGYQRIMDSRALAKPCPVCGEKVEKIQYLGGACYFCPVCQK